MVVKNVRSEEEALFEVYNYVERAIVDTLSTEKRFSMALPGGHSAASLFHKLAYDGKSLPWHSIFLFLGDDRYLPHSSSESNAKLVKENLIDKLPHSSYDDTFFPIDTTLPLNKAVSEYEDRLLHFFKGPPRFDLMLLGVGPDGHTASLFPNYPELKITDRWVAATEPSPTPPQVERITVTIPTINNSKRVLFYTRYSGKEEILDQILADKRAPLSPAQMVSGEKETVWIIYKET